MASVSGSVAADEKHSLPSRSTDHMMDTQTSQDADTQALRCYLYKRTIPHCKKCNKTGHREHVCPQPPDAPKCRVCGDSLSPNNDEDHHSCMLCGGDHPTAAKPCPKRFFPQSTDANHPGELLPPRRPSHHLPAPDGRAVRPGVQPGEGAIPGISRGPSEETRHRGAVSLASRDLKAGTWKGQRIIMANKVVPTRKQKRSVLMVYHFMWECSAPQGVPPIPNPTPSSWESALLSLRRQERQQLVQRARRVTQGNGALD
ncbi:hypothetical protein HPB51_029304 [Rhipicephalus microplus]|uniref:CCHC-type domain-containing protein n=1 Tax=Rhipicephalus microplus TaxID=6941 RepID=A0A9J6CUP5_RHIMP|nr:hypothetical protein HPB51_029304 [Rhipicephalus microplus]